MSKYFKKKHTYPYNISGIKKVQKVAGKYLMLYEIVYKYSILDRIKTRSFHEYELFRKYMPEALDVSKRTFDRWLNLHLDEPGQIPVDKLASIATYFNVQIEDLMNDLPDEITNNTLFDFKNIDLKRNAKIF
ncbi:helix-turn-helix domain-containing protein [Crocinitomix catalasitica]|uniref:helix-turn-helix domain-containing protein n=1 Tax=Crocinitomix catalasitica TaxID=184607 RepID=UPI00047FC6B1|nr:helix-turn-helix transcriptional regulator [Crocinitomix catalasitica]